MNPNNSLSERLIYGGLSLAATPVAVVESMLYAPLNMAPAARELGQVVARASLQTDPAERNLDILRGVSLGAESFTSAGSWLVGARPQDSFTQSAPELAAIRKTYTAAANVDLAATRASVEDKLARYLLNPDHPIGGSKARWFDSALGFNQGNADQLAQQIVFNEASAVKTAVIEQGTKFNQVILIKGANGKVINVTFGWIRNNDGIIRLTTGIPSKK